MGKSYLWRMDGPGVFRVHNLDTKGCHNIIIAVGPDHRELARASVTRVDEEHELARQLRAWLRHPTSLLPPSVRVGLNPHGRRWLSPDT